jgi:DNA-binding transcriptional LysR family regulator
MTITQVQYACEIARRGSMTRAAEQFYISQPALSEQIKALEIELGCALFQRSSHGTKLTEAGERFCKYAEPVISAWKALEQNCAELKNKPHSRVHIGFGVRARSNGLFEPIMSFFDSHPEISVSFTTDMNENFPEAIEAGRMDIAIGRLYAQQMTKLTGRIAIFPLLKEPQCILMSRDDPLSAEPKLPFRILDGRTVICGPEESGDDAEMREMCEMYHVRTNRVLRADDINAVIALVQRKKGYALGPVSFARFFGVAAVPLEEGKDIALNLICREDEQNDALFRHLHKHLERSLQMRTE